MEAKLLPPSLIPTNVSKEDASALTHTFQRALLTRPSSSLSSCRKAGSWDLFFKVPRKKKIKKGKILERRIDGRFWHLCWQLSTDLGHANINVSLPGCLACCQLQITELRS